VWQQVWNFGALTISMFESSRDAYPYVIGPWFVSSFPSGRIDHQRMRAGVSLWGSTSKRNWIQWRCGVFVVGASTLD